MGIAIGISRRLVRLRARNGWSQGELAVRLGVHQAAVSMWESGRRRPRTVAVVKIEDIEEAEDRRLKAEGSQEDSGG